MSGPVTTPDALFSAIPFSLKIVFGWRKVEELHQRRKKSRIELFRVDRDHAVNRICGRQGIAFRICDHKVTELVGHGYDSRHRVDGIFGKSQGKAQAGAVFMVLKHDLHNIRGYI